MSRASAINWMWSAWTVEDTPIRRAKAIIKVETIGEPTDRRPEHATEFILREGEQVTALVGFETGDVIITIDNAAVWS